VTTVPDPSGDALAVVHEFVTASLEGRLSDGQLRSFEQSLLERPEIMEAYLDYVEATLGLASLLEKLPNDGKTPPATTTVPTTLSVPIEMGGFHSPINGHGSAIGVPAAAPLPPLVSPETAGASGTSTALSTSSDFGSPPPPRSSVFSSPWLLGFGVLAGLGVVAVLVATWLPFGVLHHSKPAAPQGPAGDVSSPSVLADGAGLPEQGGGAQPVAGGSTTPGLAGGSTTPGLAGGSMVSVAGDTPEVIRLTDGSQAELEPGASAVLHGRAGGVRQLIELVKGGGTFRVQKAHGDFRVVTKLGSVTAVGTEFSVRIVPPRAASEATVRRTGSAGTSPLEAARTSPGGRLAVAVTDGTVEVEFGGKTFLLHRGEERVFGDSSLTSTDQTVRTEPSTPATVTTDTAATATTDTAATANTNTNRRVATDAVATGKTLEIKLRSTSQRTWDDVKRANYAYGPKQEFDAATGQTHIWLPYGRNGVYFDASGVKLTEPGAAGTGSPEVLSVDGNTSGRLVFKLHFDNPIGSFRLFAGWSEWGVGSNTVGGIEYSVDGRRWVTIRETDQAKIIEPFIDPDTFKAIGIKTRDLYIRCYSRDKRHPEADNGPNRWMKLRLAGDTAWGDAATTFFKAQMQLWAAPAD
jgi:hypothetical protein